jgi:hypothetical protein
MKAKKKEFREPDVEHMADLIQSEVSFFNGWNVSKRTEREACNIAARNIGAYLMRRAARRRKGE